jgi:hypothetical protein
LKTTRNTNTNSKKIKMEPLLCIPRMDKTISKEYIYKKICKLNIGCIEKITEIPLKNEADQKRIIIKVKWNDDSNTTEIKEKIINGDSLKVVHNDACPWYWKIVCSGMKQAKSQQQQ